MTGMQLGADDTSKCTHDCCVNHLKERMLLCIYAEGAESLTSPLAAALAGSQSNR